MPVPIYGSRITKSQADELYKGFIAMKENTHEDLVTLFQSNTAATRFYCGTDPQYAAVDDLAFVFNKESIEDLIELLSGTSPQADGIVVFPAIKTETTTAGRPTVMLFPFYYHDRNPANKIVIMQEYGTQHPGTSCKSKIDYDLPSEFLPGETYE